MANTNTQITDPAQAKLNGPLPGSGQVLKYPLTLGDGQADIHWIQFIIYKTTGAKMESTLSQAAEGVASNVGPKDGAISNAFSKLSAAGTSGLAGAYDVTLRQLMREPSSIVDPIIGGISVNNKERDLTTRELTRLTGLTSSIGESIHLYFPGDVKVHYGMDYAAGDLTDAANLGALLNGGQSNAEAIKEVAYQYGASKVSDLAGGYAKKIGVNGLTDSLNSNLSALNRQVANPLVELLFKKVEFRTFTFDFVFRPANADEATAVRKIIQSFALNSHPSISTSGGRFLDFPSEFDVNFMIGGIENSYLRRISRCVITKINIHSSPEKQAMMKSDGIGASPVVTNLSLTFQEVNKLDASLIAKGY